MSNKKVYLAILHARMPFVNNKNQLVKDKNQVEERCYLATNLKGDLLASASVIIDIESKTIVKSRSAYENVGVETVVNYYMDRYAENIKKFYQYKFGTNIE